MASTYNAGQSGELQERPFSVRLDVDELAALRALAIANERSIAAELRIAIRRHLRTEGRDTK